MSRTNKVPPAFHGYPVKQSERVQWALDDLLRAIDAMRANMGDAALQLAVVARKRDYDDAATAEARAREVAANHMRQTSRLATVAQKRGDDLAISNAKRKLHAQRVVEGLRRRGVYDKGAA